MIEFLAFSKIGMDFSLSRFFEKNFFFFFESDFGEKKSSGKIIFENNSLKLSGKIFDQIFISSFNSKSFVFFKNKTLFFPKQNEILDRSSERAKDVFPCSSRGRKSHRAESANHRSETFWKEAIKFITDSRITNFSTSPKKIPF